MKQVKKVLKNQAGFAVLLGLFVLFMVTIAGLSVIVLAQKDKVSSGDSAKIREVAVAANASMKAFENQLKAQPQLMAQILNKYVVNNNYKWLLVSDTSSAKVEKKVPLGTNGLSYSVKITAYDDVNQVVQVTGTGYGRGNEQKCVVAMYKLSGLQKIVTGETRNAKYALYLAGDGRNFDSKMNIAGDVYCGNDFHFNGGATGSSIAGFLKTGKNTSKQSSFDASGVSIDSGVYIGTGLKLNGTVTSKGLLGVEGPMVLDAMLYCNADAWFNDANGGSNKINMSSSIIHHSGKIDMSRVVAASEDNKSATITDIVDQIGLGSTIDSVWTVDTTGLYAKALPLPSSITAEILQVMYDTCSVSNKVNGYMVVYDQWGSIAVNSSSAAFNGKVIFLLKYGLNVNKQFFNMTSSSRVFIYAYNWATLNGFGGPAANLFNGVVFLNDNAGISMSWSGLNTINGAIHVASTASSWQCNGGSGSLNLSFSESIVSEFELMGILHRPVSSGVVTTVVTDAVTLTDMKIRPQLVGIVY